MFKKQQAIQFIDLKSKSGQLRKFFKVKYLGSGGFARCYQVFQEINNVKSHYAFKIIKKSTLFQSKQLIQRLRIQIRLHKKISEPLLPSSSQHIVRYIQSFQTQQYIYLLLQLCINQTLNELIRRRKFLTQQQTKFFIWQLACGLKQIHSQNIIHRDIKLCNLFLTHGLKLKIGDFGLANQIISQKKRLTLCGTANYIAPQMLQKDQNGAPIGHGYEVDVWGLGVVCYTIFFGKYPFESQDQKSIYNKILECKYSFNPYNFKEMKQFNINAINHFPSQDLKLFLREIFQIDPAKRLTLEQVLQHRFLTKTQIPDQLPEIALKCPIKKQKLDEIFCLNTKQQENNKKQETLTVNIIQKYLKTPHQIFQSKQQSTRQSCFNLRKTVSIEQQTEINLQKSQKYSINQMQNITESHQQQKSSLQNQKLFSNDYRQKLFKKDQNQKNMKSESNKILIRISQEKLLKFRKSSSQNTSSKQLNLKSSSKQFLLEIIPQKREHKQKIDQKVQEQIKNMQKYIVHKQKYSSTDLKGFMIKVYEIICSINFKTQQSLQVKYNALSLSCNQKQSFKQLYTLIIHPKLNYITKVHSQNNKLKYLIQRQPLEQIISERENKDIKYINKTDSAHANQNLQIKQSQSQTRTYLKTYFEIKQLEINSNQYEVQEKCQIFDTKKVEKRVVQKIKLLSQQSISKQMFKYVQQLQIVKLGYRAIKRKKQIENQKAEIKINVQCNLEQKINSFKYIQVKEMLQSEEVY